MYNTFDLLYLWHHWTDFWLDNEGNSVLNIPAADLLMFNIMVEIASLRLL